MHTRTLLLLLLSTLIAAQSEVLFFTRVPNPITDGEAAVILWSTNDTANPVTLTLLQGRNTSNLATVEVITKAGEDGQYVWRPAVSIANGEDYALGITQGTQQNYFGPLQVQGASPPAVASASVAPSLSASMSAANTTKTMTGGNITTLTRNATATMHKTTPKNTEATTTTVDASSTSTSASASASSSEAAHSGSTAAGSSFALLFGAIAVLCYLQ